jgi:hypothetical protein
MHLPSAPIFSGIVHVLSHATKDENDTTEAQGTQRKRRTLCGLGVLAVKLLSRGLFMSSVTTSRDDEEGLRSDP